MPTRIYTDLHPDAKLSDSDQRDFKNWVDNSLALRTCIDSPKLRGLANAPKAAPEVAARNLIEKRCQVCHLPGGSGYSFADLSNLSKVRSNAKLLQSIIDAVKKGRMPPGAGLTSASQADAEILEGWRENTKP